MPYRTIWRCYQNLSSQFETAHPFSSRSIYTDGKRIFNELLLSTGEVGVQDSSDRQGVIDAVLRPFLSKVQYEHGKAVRWNIARGVLVDPTIAFGKPTVESTGVATHVLASAYRANKRSVETVADIYDVSIEDVVNAVEFEDRMKAGDHLRPAA
ncbi:MAG: DUF433 domain-containing protein [Phycisphaerales bacterium]